MKEKCYACEDEDSLGSVNREVEVVEKGIKNL